MVSHRNRYTRIIAERETTIKRLLRSQTANRGGRIKALSAENEKKQDVINQLRADITKKEVQIRNMGTELMQKERQIIDETKKFDNLRLSSLKDLSDSQLKLADEEKRLKSSLLDEKKKYDKDISQKKNEIERLKVKLADEEKNLKSSLLEEKKKYDKDISQKENEIERLKVKLADEEKNLKSSLLEEKKKYDKDISQKENEIERLKVKLADEEKNLKSSLLEEKKKYDKDISQKENEIERLKVKLADEEQLKVTLADEEKSLKSSLLEEKKKYDQDISEKDKEIELLKAKLEDQAKRREEPPLSFEDLENQSSSARKPFSVRVEEWFASCSDGIKKFLALRWSLPILAILGLIGVVAIFLTMDSVKLLIRIIVAAVLVLWGCSLVFIRAKKHDIGMINFLDMVEKYFERSWNLVETLGTLGVILGFVYLTFLVEKQEKWTYQVIVFYMSLTLHVSSVTKMLRRVDFLGLIDALVVMSAMLIAKLFKEKKISLGAYLGCLLALWILILFKGIVPNREVENSNTGEGEASGTNTHT